MRKVGKGDYSARFVKGKMGFEINDIVITLNQMIDDLLKHMEAVKNERVEKETLANELKIGRSIQLSILPQEMPVFPEADLAAGTFPAKEVGGDFYDLYVLENPEDEDKHKLVLTIADAAGKGISACLYSLCLRSMLRSYLIESSDLGKSVRLANNLFFLDTEKSSMFVTAFLGLFDCQTREFEFFCAGHHPTILRRADGTIEFLSTGHMALGVMPLDELSHKKVILNPGDLLVFYTDGVVEALNKRDEGYGEARLIDVIERHANQPVSEIWHEIVADINRFAQDAPQHDDITLIVMRVL
jgi:sigma-B regulation protein RsbU (phosphoserine phosphatase)